MVCRDEILAIITKQFNIIIKEYPIEVLNGGFELWEEISGILDIKVWQSNLNNIFKENVESKSFEWVGKQ